MNRIKTFFWAAGGLLGLIAAVYFTLPFFLRTGADEAPLNFVAIDANLSTSGQPSKPQLSKLREQGYELVINLAPPSSYGSLEDEGAVVGESGLTYLNIPVDWEKPAERDFALFADTLTAHRGRKVFVHCQMNLRASVFVFLYRAVHEKVNVDGAFEKVNAVWAPNDNWRTFIRRVLHGRTLPLAL